MLGEGRGQRLHRLGDQLVGRVDGVLGVVDEFALDLLPPGAEFLLLRSEQGFVLLGRFRCAAFTGGCPAATFLPALTVAGRGLLGVLRWHVSQARRFSSGALPGTGKVLRGRKVLGLWGVSWLRIASLPSVTCSGRAPTEPARRPQALAADSRLAPAWPVAVVEQFVEQRAVVHHRAAQLLRGRLMAAAAVVDLVGGAVVLQRASVFD